MSDPALDYSWTTWFTWNMPMTAALLARCLPVRRLNYPLRSRLTSNQHQYQYHYQGGVFAVGAVVGSMVEC